MHSTLPAFPPPPFFSVCLPLSLLSLTHPLSNSLNPSLSLPLPVKEPRHPSSDRFVLSKVSRRPLSPYLHIIILSFFSFWRRVMPVPSSTLLGVRLVFSLRSICSLSGRLTPSWRDTPLQWAQWHPRFVCSSFIAKSCFASVVLCYCNESLLLNVFNS